MTPVSQFIESSLGQVTSVSQLSDVEPTSWAFQALQSLVERYGCIAGYPDGLYRGDRPLSRYEFAAGLDACLGKISELLDAQTAELFSETDLVVIERLQGEFAAELAAVRRQVTDLEERADVLEAQQFSPIVVMGGESIFGLAVASGDGPGRSDGQATFAHLTRIQLAASLTGRDRLRIQFATGNFDNDGYAGRNALGTDMARLAYQSDLDNEIILDILEYRWVALGDRVVFTLRPVGFDLSTVLTANSPFFDTGRGALSRFMEASPVFKIGGLDTGGGLDWLMGDRARLQLAYGVRGGADTSQGLAGGDHYAAGAQLLLKPADNLLTGLAYIHSYAENGRLDTFTGSLNADLSGDLDAPATIHGLSGTVQWRVSPQITLAAWGGWIHTNYLDRDAYADATTYALSMGISDPFGREGDLWAFAIGQPPRLKDGEDVRIDPDVSLHLETFYRFRVTDHISITPGFFVVTNPEHDADNDTIFVGAIRTTFRF